MHLASGTSSLDAKRGHFIEIRGTTLVDARFCWKGRLKINVPLASGSHGILHEDAKRVTHVNSNVKWQSHRP